MSEGVIVGKFLNGVSHLAAFGREIGIPTEAALPHMFANAFKNVAALCADIDIEFKQIEDVKKFLANPEAFAAANAVAAPAAAAGGGGGAKAAAAAVVEEEEEEADFDLFG